MKNIFTILIFLCVFTFCASAQPLPAQKQVDIFAALQAQANGRARRADETADNLWRKAQQTGETDTCALAAVLRDTAYIQRLSEPEVLELLFSAQLVAAEYTACRDGLLKAVLEPLSHAYNENAADFTLNELRLMFASVFARVPQLQESVLKWAFEQASRPMRTSDGNGGEWAAQLLAMVATPEEEGETQKAFFSDRKRADFEFQLERLIGEYDQLMYLKTDYWMGKVANGLGITNQTAMISLFSQTNNWFAMKSDDSFLKSMVSTGGLNPVFRSSGTPGFSEEAEVFYLHMTTPGTDGKGNYANTANGRRHHTLTLLMAALFTSYHAQGTADSSQKMEAFIRRYLATNSRGEFTHYLYVALQGFRLADAAHDTDTVHGWPAKERLGEMLKEGLMKGYLGKQICTAVQGAAEVCAEWVATGKLLKGVFSIFKGSARLGMKSVVRVLPVRTVMYMGIVQAAGTKGVMYWGRNWMKSALKKFWKPVAGAGAAGVGVKATKRDPAFSSDAYAY